MAVQSSTDQTFKTDVEGEDGVVLVDFWAEWCGPCRMIAPVLDELDADFGGKIKIVKVNIDENPETPVKFGVRSIPALMLFKGGEVVEMQVGALSKVALEDWINRSL